MSTGGSVYQSYPTGIMCPVCTSVLYEEMYIGGTYYRCKNCGFCDADPPRDGKYEVKWSLPDSGNRREFSSGAVRDVAEGKGRCDLLPIGTLARMLDSPVLRALEDISNITAEQQMLDAFDAMAHEIGYKKERAVLEVSIHFEAGAKKYGERNWEKGIPLHCYLDSAIRHYLKWRDGDKDEPHDRAVLWNLVCGAWTAANQPEMCDLP